MKRAILAFIVSTLLAVAASAQLPVCNVAAQIFDVNGQPRPNFRITVVRVVKNGQLISNTPSTYTTNASGQVTIPIPQASTAWVYANAYNLDSRGAAGVPLTIPAAGSAQLETLVQLTGVFTALTDIFTTQGDTVYGGVNGVATRLAGSIEANLKFFGQLGTGTASAAPAWYKPVAGSNVTFSFDHDAKTWTINSTGGGGGGSLLTREIDGTPSITTTLTLEFAQANGFVLTDQGSGVARLDLSAIPFSALATLTANRALATNGSGAIVVSGVSDTELGHLGGVTSAIQTQLNAKSPNARTLTAGTGLIGGGDLSADRTFDIGSGTGITVNANDIAINQAFAATWTGLHTFNTGTTPGNVVLVDIAAIGSTGTRDSHNIILRGRSDDGSGHAVEWKEFVDVTSNAGASAYTIQSRIDSGSFTNRLTVTDGGAVTATSFSGDGSGLTALNGTNISTGTVANDRLDSDLTALGDNSTNGLWARTGAGAGSAVTITGTANQVNVANGSGSGGNPTLSLPQSIHTGATPQFAALGLGEAAPTAGLELTGKTISTDADNTVGAADATFSLTKNNSNTRTFPGLLIKPTINTGGSNANTTLNVLAVDTTNTATTGVTTNLLRLAYGGSQQFVVTSGGAVTATSFSGDGSALTALNAGNLSSGTLPSGRFPALTGDVTTSAGSISTTIANDAVTFAKMQNIATDRLIGRDTASSGDPEEIALAGSLVFTGSSSIQLSGDASSPGNSKYYGTDSGGTKGFFDLPAGGSSHTMLSATHTDTTAGTVARGDLITGQTASPKWQRLAIGANNRVLFSDGTDVSWSTVPNAALANSSITINGTTNQVSVSGSPVSLGGTITLSTPQNIHTSATPQFAALGLGEAAPTAGLELTGKTISTDADGTVGAADLTFSLTKNNSNTRTFPGLLIKPTINTGGSNANTTLNVLAVDTTNTATTGVTTNLILASYGGSAQFTVTSGGAVTATSFSGSGASLTSLNASNISSGTLNSGRLDTDVVQTDQANTWSTGAQDFGSATSLKVPTSGGAAPTSDGLLTTTRLVIAMLGVRAAPRFSFRPGRFLPTC